jgi:hypothetical protein
MLSNGERRKEWLAFCGWRFGGPASTGSMDTLVSLAATPPMLTSAHYVKAERHQGTLGPLAFPDATSHTRQTRTHRQQTGNWRVAEV